jgi:hypothetical protein
MLLNSVSHEFKNLKTATLKFYILEFLEFKSAEKNIRWQIEENSQ